MTTHTLGATAVIDAVIDAFIEAHPHGWKHDDWNALLAELSAAGMDTADGNRIGLELERARLRRVLETAEIRGLGPKRIEAIVEQYPTLWSLKCATPDDLTVIPILHPKLAQSVLKGVNSVSL